MSQTSSIDIYYLSNGEKISEIIQILINFGWSVNDSGSISYLPLGDKDSFNWQRVSLDKINDILKLIDEKEENEELIGITMVWKDSNIGGEFLFNGKSQLSVNLSVNRKLLSECDNFTDVSWYIEKLFKSFNISKLRIESAHWEEHV